MAIAIDAVSSGHNDPVTSVTYSHTCSGSNRMLIVLVGSLRHGDTITGVTYAGVSMTLHAKTPYTAGQELYMFYLYAPATGANNVVVSANTATNIGSASASYTGVKQTGFPDAQVINTVLGGQTSITTTVTVATANSWLVGVYQNDVGDFTAGANTFIRSWDSGDQKALPLCDSNGAQATGSRSMTLTIGSANVVGIMVSMSPLTSTDYPLTATKQDYALTMQGALFHYGAKLLATFQTYALNGQAVILRLGKAMIATMRTYALTFEPALFHFALSVKATMQTYALTGQSVFLRIAMHLRATQQSYQLTGIDILTHIGRKLFATYQTYALSLQDALFHRGTHINPTKVDFTLTFENALFHKAVKLIATVASYILTFNPVRLLYNGFAIRYTNGTKHSAVFGNGTKHSSNWINEARS